MLFKNSKHAMNFAAELPYTATEPYNSVDGKYLFIFKLDEGVALLTGGDITHSEANKVVGLMSNYNKFFAADAAIVGGKGERGWNPKK